MHFVLENRGCRASFPPRAGLVSWVAGVISQLERGKAYISGGYDEQGEVPEAVLDRSFTGICALGVCEVGFCLSIETKL